MLMKKDILWIVKAGASTGGSRVIALGDGPRGREPLDIFGPVLEYFSQYFRTFCSGTFGIFLKIFLNISEHIFSTGGLCVIALGDGPQGKGAVNANKKVILTQFFNLAY